MAKGSRMEEYQLLILTKLDEHGKSIEKLSDDVVEIKTNHLAHIATDIELLKHETKETSSRLTEHDKWERGTRTATANEKWKFWSVLVGGICTIIGSALAAAYYFAH